MQAGASEEGLALAARTADAVFISHPTMESCMAFYKDLKQRVADTGRDPASMRILTAIQPVPAGSDAEGRREAERMNTAIPVELGLSYLSTALGGIALDGLDLDGPLPDLPPSNASQGTRTRIHDMARRGMSLGEIAVAIAAMRTSRPLIGTPQTIADELERWIDADACDGFVVSPAAMLERFVEAVVPELQRRGRMRTAYESDILRENLGLLRPQSRYPLDRSLRREPEIWKRG